MIKRPVGDSKAYWLSVLVRCSLLVGVLAGCALAVTGQETAATGQETAATGQEKEEQGEPLLTDEDGKQYWLERMPKKDLGRFERLEGNTLRTAWGFTISYEAEDEEAFYLRHYIIDFVPPDRHAKPTAEELEAVAQTYRFELPEDDRLTFAAFDEGLPRQGQWRQGFDVADMNGDGHLDLVHGPPRGLPSTPIVFLGDGAGAWRIWDAEYPPLAYDYGDVAAADFDGDGRLDLALGNHLRGQLVLVQREPGHFFPWSEGVDFAATSGGDSKVFSSRALEAVDWDEDGRVDVLALGEGPTLPRSPVRSSTVEGSYGLVLYRNLGDGRWERKDSGATPEEGFGDALTVADFNRDGRSDVLRGTFLAGQQSLLYLGTGDTWEITSLDGIRPRAYVRDVTAADVNRDGKVDFALSYASYELDRWRNGIDLFLAREDGSWERRTVLAEEGRQGFWALASGDLQGDGRTDLVGLTGDGQVLVLLGDEDGRFVREVEELLDPVGGCRGYAVHLADVSGDGKDELIAALAGEPKRIFTGAGDPGCPGQGSLRVWTARVRGPSSSAPPPESDLGARAGADRRSP